MDKLKMHSPDLTQENIKKLMELFPGCVTEIKEDEEKDKGGRLKDESDDDSSLSLKPSSLRYAVDFDQLKQELSDHIIEGPQERYQLNWPGKREALLTANTPIAKTLRPCRKESVDFDATQNLFIEGDNLEALKLLQDTYLGKVKMIYIDPPYNTGNDFIYEDDFAESSKDFFKRSNQKDEDSNRLVSNTDSNGRFHSDWLSMMYSRLKLSRTLLKDDGIIVIHIDENEYPNLEKILTEIFGEQNNLGTVVWDKRNPKGDSSGIAQQHELISFYCKDQAIFKEKVNFMRPKENAEAMINKAVQLIHAEGEITTSVRKQYKDWLKNKKYSGGDKAYSHIDDNGDVYRPVSMAWPNKKKAPDDYFKPLIHPITNKECPIPGRGWRNPPATMAKLIKDGLILFGKDETTQPNRKYLLKDNLYENVSSLLYYGGSDDSLLADLGLWFDTPKVVNVSKRLIQSIVSENDIILDFFAGSATSAHAVMQLNAEDGINLNFVMVQLPEATDEKSEAYKDNYKTIAEISKDRIRRAGKKILESECHENWNKDIGFRVLKIDTSNMADVYYSPDQIKQDMFSEQVNNIKKNREDPEDLLFQVLLDWGVGLTLPVREETIQQKTVFFVSAEPYDLIACFDPGITEALVKELAGFHPLRVVFRDNGFISDAVKINVDQIFKQLSPGTEVKSI